MEESKLEKEANRIQHRKEYQRDYSAKRTKEQKKEDNDKYKAKKKLNELALKQEIEMLKLKLKLMKQKMPVCKSDGCDDKVEMKPWGKNLKFSFCEECQDAVDNYLSGFEGVTCQDEHDKDCFYDLLRQIEGIRTQ